MKKTILHAVAFVICLLTIQSCDREYLEYKRDFQFNTDGGETIIGFSHLEYGYRLHEDRMIFETTATEDYLILSIPECAINGNAAKPWTVYTANESQYARIQSMKIVFSLRQGKFVGNGSEYTTSFDNFDAEVYAYDLWNGNTSHSLWNSDTYYAYTIEVLDAELKLDTFKCKDGDCNKLICKGSFNISSELTILNEKDEQVTRVPLNFSDGSFECTPLSQVTE